MIQIHVVRGPNFQSGHNVGEFTFEQMPRIGEAIKQGAHVRRVRDVMHQIQQGKNVAVSAVLID